MNELVSELATVGVELEDRYTWHRCPSTYIVLVSEYFLRRTNRSTVERYLPSFFKRFPSLDTLAEADPEEVASSAKWAGLRSRSLHLPEVARQFRCRLDWDATSLRELPYIGAYAADAIALYAFDQPALPIDNNVRRVVSRFFALGEPGSVEAMVDELKSSAFTMGGVATIKAVHRGLLHLGWVSCRSAPACEACPLRFKCAFRCEIQLR